MCDQQQLAEERRKQEREKEDQEIAEQAAEQAFHSTNARFEGMFLRTRKMQVFNALLQERGVDPETIRALELLKWNGGGELNASLFHVTDSVSGSGEQKHAGNGNPKHLRKSLLRDIIERTIRSAQL